MAKTYIAKVDSKTMEVLQTFNLPPALYLGGLLMHANGNVFCVHSNVLYSFNDGDLNDVKVFPLPTKLNNGIVQTNGMLVSQDGYIIIKQWALIIDDVFFYASCIPILVRMSTILFIFLRSRRSLIFMYLFLSSDRFLYFTLLYLFL